MLRLRQLIQDLPISLVLASLFLTSSALPVQTAVLTPEDFKPTISKGLWFIEHFSPYCGHCRAFAPTWEELIKLNEQGDYPGMHLAQVNCAVNGDLCDENGVKGYPQMNLYKDGKFVEQYKAKRELDQLSSFLKKHAEPAADTPPPPPAVIAKPTVNAPILNPSGTVSTLDDKTFQATLNKGPAFVKFYAPWCGHCKKLAPTWKNLAKHLQNKLTIAEVNCEDHGALCKSEGIQGYPTLIYYTEGVKTEYNGGRKLDLLKTFAEKASSAATQAIQPDEIEKLVADNEVVYLLLHPEDSSLLHSLAPVFSRLLGTPKIYTIANPSSTLRTRFSLPSSTSWALVALKDHDAHAPTSIYTSSTPTVDAETEIAAWLFKNRLPPTSELTQDTFQSIMNAAHQPLVVLAAVTADTKDAVAQRMNDVARKWRVRTGGTGLIIVDGPGRGREVVFAWMDVERWKEWMKSMYGITVKADTKDLDNVDVVIADHQNLVYYATDTTGSPIKLSSTASLFGAIEGAASGKVQALHSENLVERVARYMNNKLTSLQDYVVNNPLHAAFFVLVGFAVMIFALKRFVSNDDLLERDMKEKVGRLD